MLPDEILTKYSSDSCFWLEYVKLAADGPDRKKARTAYIFGVKYLYLQMNPLSQSPVSEL